MLPANLEKAIDASVQTAQVNTQKEPFAIDGAWDVWGLIRHPEIVSAWGYKRRDRELREISYAVHNGLFQGAVGGLIMRVQATPWEIKAGRNIARYYQDLLQNSDFHDWETWIARTLWDFFTQDFGAVCEVIGAGNPAKPISGRVLGLAHMDALSCYATKSSEYPVVYWNEESNEMHRMEQSRVHRFTDMTSPRRLAYGLGLCALSRYLSEANVDILLGRHDNEMLNDLPPAGLLSITGLQETQWNQAVANYEANRRADGQSVFRQTLVLLGLSPDAKVTAESTPFSALPENFNAKEFIDTHVNKLALALGVDPQDIWPLSGQALGTGTQSTILHSKAQGKMYGRILQMITRFINRKVLPDGAEFAFKYKDSQQDAETANTAKIWVDITNSATYLSDEEKRRLIADMVEPIRDVITDENGEVVELPDDDPKEDEQTVITAPDVNPLGAPANPPDIQANLQGQANPPNAANDNGGTAATIPDDGKLPPGNKGLVLDGGHGTHVARKEYDATKRAFVDDVAANISDAANGTISKAAFAIRMRAAIARYGKNAYLDGLAEGGVDVDTLEGDDSDQYAAILAEQSQYVTDARSTITDFSGDAKARAELWQKSLDPFHYAGIESADKNGMYMFDGDDGDESCRDCRRLKGTSHRMSWWVKNELRPVQDGHNFECGGWRCQHKLVKKAK